MHQASTCFLLCVISVSDSANLDLLARHGVGVITGSLFINTNLLLRLLPSDVLTC